MSKLLVILEHDRGSWVEANDEAMTAGRKLAARMTAQLEAVLIGESSFSLADQAGVGGADVIHQVSDPVLVDYGPEAYAAAVVALVAETAPEAVLSIGTDRGNEVMAHVAAMTDLPFVANCSEVEPADGAWSVTRMQWGGSLLEDAALTAPMKLLSYAHHSIRAEASESPGPGVLRDFAPGLDPILERSVIVDRHVEAAGVTLATAPVVVSGGRGVGSSEGFACLEELAELLGGRVGCSRAVTNNGWRNHSDQVGQTGTRIAPQLYIATGISGAIQHWVGARASKLILAINTDADANMVTKADYAIVADLHEVIPAITAEIRRRAAD